MQIVAAAPPDILKLVLPSRLGHLDAVSAELRWRLTPIQLGLVLPPLLLLPPFPGWPPSRQPFPLPLLLLLPHSRQRLHSPSAGAIKIIEALNYRKIKIKSKLNFYNFL